MDVLKVIDLDVGESPVLSRYAQYNHESLYKREVGESELEQRCDDGSRGQKKRDLKMLHICLEDGGRGHKPRNEGRL